MIADIILRIAAMERTEEDAYRPRPSSAGPHRCIRQMVYHGLGVQRQPLPGRAVLIFDDSSWHEELTADWIRKSAFRLHSQQMEVTMPDEATGITLSGHIDGIITDMLEIDRLFEHKAINHFTFQKYVNGEIPLDYVVQCCLYIRGLHTVIPMLNEAVLLVKNKNTAQYMEFIIRYDHDTDTAAVVCRTISTGETFEMGDTFENITGDAFNKFKTVQNCIETKKLPPRQYDRFDDKDGWHCDYCGWGGVCWEGYEKEFQDLKIEGMLPGEIADMVRYYKELGAQKKDIENEYNDMMDRIKASMEGNGHREGVAGEYVCRLKIESRNSIDKSRLTAQEIQKATKTSTFKRLYISTNKEGSHAE